MKDWVLVRGMMSEAFHWWDFLPQLKSSFPEDRFHLADIHGTGATGRKLTPLNIPANLRLLREQVRMETPARKIVLGFSLGGMLALEWAYHHPEEVDGLVLINCSLKSSRFYHRMTPFALAQIFKISYQRNAIARDELSLGMSTNLPPEKVRELARHWNARAKEYPVSPLNFFAQLALASRMSMRPAPPKIPILLLNSAKDRVVHPQCSQDLAQAWSLPLHTHPEAGHDLTLDDPDWVTEKIKIWKRSLDPQKARPREPDLTQTAP